MLQACRRSFAANATIDAPLTERGEKTGAAAY
jgi:hypothetical protein